MPDPFEAYRLPSAMTEGAYIELAGTPATFHVRLPGRSNDEFAMKLLRRLSESGRDVDGNVNVIEMQMERRALFFDECIIEAKGLPEGMDPSTFFETYPLAAKMLFERAQELALEADQEVDDAMEKLLPTQSGPRSGGASTNNTKKSSKRVSNRAQSSRKSAA